ncbi:putative mRNA decapping hydrolase [Trichodelitschia bisporula]|uniref:Putative mRNA decapping hydrolase n=1 Tax=Trichodelitschia bisporula TaxID=703511 RepID=A0A6G1HLC9_9PEZI|nr:putative mRNA decapping hydrolase [Trichodelitschia bisporula]
MSRDPAAEALVPKFQFEKLLNQDQAGRRVVLLGSIDDVPALLIAERAPFAADPEHLSSFASSLANVTNLGNNDIYKWYLASSSSASASADSQPPDLKINLFHPCTPQLIAKYSRQGIRVVTETPTVYAEHVRPYVLRKQAEGRVNWVFNILEGRTEQEDVMYREHGPEGFLVLPDLNWDRKTVTALHLLGIVERRDLLSLRDLKKEHVDWLRHVKRKLVDATLGMYPKLEWDQLKFYVHYQPTYYHLHIHIVHVELEAGATQAVGKAISLDNIISQLETMPDGKGMADVELTYTIGEASELWIEVFEPRRKELRDNA